MTTRAALAFIALCAIVRPAAAQGPPLTLPQPSPAATVSQQIGLTDVTIAYHRPAVGKRQVWGALVPYDQVWRAGANENTVVTFSSDVTVGGQKVPAGSYGLHMIPTQKDWTVIVSRESRAWGSFFYDQKDDVARLTVAPRPADFVERLSYTFDDPTDKSVVATLRWEKLAIPISIEVDTPAVVAASLRTQLKGLQGFSWQSFAQAASWCARHDVNLEEAQAWADRAVSMTENFATLRAQALVSEKLGNTARAQDAARQVADDRDRGRHERLRLSAPPGRKDGRGDCGVSSERREVSGVVERVRQPRRRARRRRAESRSARAVSEGAIDGERRDQSEAD